MNNNAMERKRVRPLREPVDENLCEISLNAQRARHPKVFIKTFGCQMNFRDSEIIAGIMKNAGFAITDTQGKADIILFNTCSVREHAEERVFGQIRQLTGHAPQSTAKKRNTRYSLLATPNQPIIGLIGCMAQNYKSDIFNKLPQVDIVSGPGNIYDLPDLVRLALSGDTHILSCDKQKNETIDVSVRTDRIKSFVNIMEGCDNFCSYCVVPYVRGRQISRRMDDIITEIKHLAKNGYKEVTLLGQNVNSYGINDKCQMSNVKEKKSDFVKLLEEINKIKGIERIKFITSHPKDASLDLFKAMAYLDKVCQSLHLPVQSGSDKILKLMNRKYTSAHYCKLIGQLRKLIPGVTLSTDIVVGFPNETEADFNDTVNLLKQIKFDNVYVFKYSPRPKTAAALFKDNVPVDVKQKRNQIILELAKDIAARRNLAFIGTTQEVLVEAVAEKHKGMLIGRTRTDKTVLFSGKDSLVGKLINVKIKDTNLYSLIGQRQ